jgi:acetyl-CoA synthetase
MENFDWSSIKVFSSTGECSNADDMNYLMSLANNKPIIEYCGGTEIGGAYITSTLIQPIAPTAFTTAALGIDFVLLDEQGQLTDNGEIALIPPSIGLSTALLNKDHHAAYYADMPTLPSGQILRRHGDQIKKFPNGFYCALGRADDTMNLGGIKVSSADIERVLADEPNIIETAAIAVTPQGGGPSELIIYAVTQPNTVLNKLEMKNTLQKSINMHLNPLFKIQDIIFIDALPRTASNKVMRRILRNEYERGANQAPPSSV